MKKDSRPNPVDRLQDLPCILAALKAGVAAALRQHARDGLPVAVWEKGKVVWVAPEDIPDIG